MTEIKWGDPTLSGGVIDIDDEGLTVHTECHGCSSETLTDRSKIRKLYHALGDWLIAHPIVEPTMSVDPNDLWTLYVASADAPALDSITQDGRTLHLPDGYEAHADRITVSEVYTNMVATWLTLEAKEKGLVLDRLMSRLYRGAPPIRLVLVGYPKNGVTKVIHLPIAVLELVQTDSSLVVCGRRDEDAKTMRRDFWFGPGLTTRPGTEETP